MSQFANLIDPAHRAQILNDRITQFAAEGYQHELNHEIAVATGDEQGTENAAAAIAIILTAIEVHQADLQALVDESA